MFRIRLTRKSRLCHWCTLPSNPLSLYRGFWAKGWYHRDCLPHADYNAVVTILINGSAVSG